MLRPAQASDTKERTHLSRIRHRKGFFSRRWRPLHACNNQGGGDRCMLAAIHTSYVCLPLGLVAAHGDVLRVFDSEELKMVVVLACCCVDDKYGLLVREGSLQASTQNASTWIIQAPVQYMRVHCHRVQTAAFWRKRANNIIEILH